MSGGKWIVFPQRLFEAPGLCGAVHIRMRRLPTAILLNPLPRTARGTATGNLGRVRYLGRPIRTHKMEPVATRGPLRR